MTAPPSGLKLVAARCRNQRALAPPPRRNDGVRRGCRRQVDIDNGQASRAGRVPLQERGAARAARLHRPS